MLVPRLLQRLTVAPRDHPRGQAHWSAASGLVRAGDHLYVVADDEHHLAWLDATTPGASPLNTMRFAQGDLPDDPAARKKRKPDIEVLLHLPAAVTGSHDWLVLLGSGSRPQRERVFGVAPQSAGPAAPAIEVAAHDLYAPLADAFGEPNVEAACLGGGQLHLFQRANRGRATNVRLSYDAQAFCAWLRGAAGAPRPEAILPLSLGSYAGVPFGITDASAWWLPGCVFTAVAEDTQDAYADGACVASMVGWLDDAGTLRASALLAGAPKVEGITPAGRGRLWLVTDADDPDRPSELLEVDWDPHPGAQAGPLSPSGGEG